MSSSDILFALAALLASAGTTGLVRAYALKTNLLDVPNHRSSHNVGTPRGGGFSFVVVFLVSVLVCFFLRRIELQNFLSLFIGGFIVAGVGFLDDHNDVRASHRLLVQIFAAVIVLVLLGGLPDIPLGAGRVDLGLIGDVIAVVLIVWLINLYNFMDGIDGLAAIQTLTVVFGAVFLLHFQSDNEVSLLLVIFGASVAGFLIWNWPPAKIFMGDVGSGFLGFVLAVFGIITSTPELLSSWVWVILSGLFIVDSTMTLIVRIIRGEEWYSPHNSHAYQIAARRFGGHRPITVTVFLINVFWLLPIAWVATVLPGSGWWLCVVALTPLIMLAHFLGAGRQSSDNPSK